MLVAPSPGMMSSPTDVSVVVPLYNEEESVRPLVEAVQSALQRTEWAWEIVLVDDGSSDSTAAVCRSVAASLARVRTVELARNFGQTAAMQAGFDYARGQRIVTMDGDLQNDPRDIPKLLDKLGEGYDLVTGYRVNRKDKLLTRKIPSWLANRLIAAMTGVHIRDNGCSLKAYHRTLLERLRIYSDQHRFLPALAVSFGARVAEIPVRHHPRRFGRSKYGLSRTFKVLADLVSVKMVTTFRSHPLVAFAVGSAVSMALATLFAGAWLVSFLEFQPLKAFALVFPASALLWLAVAIYLLVLGLIAEVAVGVEEHSESQSPILSEVS